MKLRVGFIGLGLMGNPMAKNILKKGFPLVVYNRSAEKVKEFAILGAEVANSPFDLASRVDVLITMVTAGEDVEQVLFGKNGVIKSAKEGLIVIDMSTIGPTAAKAIAGRLASLGIDFLDAPVTGSTPKAISGELTIFVGGKKDILEKMRAVLSAMGTNIVYMGEAGTGQAMKMINNFFIASCTVALSEGMLLADGMSLTRKKVADAFMHTPNLSPMMQLKLSNYVKNEFPLAFSLSNMRKDLRLALSEMRSIYKQLTGLVRVESLYGKASEDTNLAREDFSAIIKQIQRNSETKRRK